MVVVGGTDGAALTLGAFAMPCGFGAGAALTIGARGCEARAPAVATGWWAQRVSLSISTHPKPTSAGLLESSGIAFSYLMQKREIPSWYCGASPIALMVMPGESLASGCDVGSECCVTSIGEVALVTFQCCGLLGSAGVCRVVVSFDVCVS